MARVPRAFQGGHCYHVMNRGNARTTVFHSNRDYFRFLKILNEAQERLAMTIYSACLMPNHFHLVLRPHSRGDMSRWMHWVMTTHVARHRKIHHTVGRIWQGRFKAFPIQQDAHLHAVMRYVERNALRAGLVQRAETWPWGSLHWRDADQAPIKLADSPAGLPAGWIQWVNEPQTSAELESLRRSAHYQVPFGDADWLKTVEWGHC